MNIRDFARYKKNGRKISMITCYDYSSARIVNKSDVDTILVGDSLSMVIYGHHSTCHADIATQARHTEAVARGAPDKFILGDLPFLSYRKGLQTAMDAMHTLICAGAHAVKLEGAGGNLEIIAHAVESGIPVMGHLGLTPQSVNALGGFHVQANSPEAADALLEDAFALQEAGCFALVLEAVPASVARAVTENLDIPTIGIGAGNDCDGQVLVMQDMLGMDATFQPKFVRRYLEGQDLIKNALNNYHHEVLNREFPADKETYHGRMDSDLSRMEATAV